MAPLRRLVLQIDLVVRADSDDVGGCWPRQTFTFNEVYCHAHHCRCNASICQAHGLLSECRIVLNHIAFLRDDLSTPIKMCFFLTKQYLHSFVISQDLEGFLFLGLLNICFCESNRTKKPKKKTLWSTTKCFSRLIAWINKIWFFIWFTQIWNLHYSHYCILLFHYSMCHMPIFTYLHYNTQACLSFPKHHNFLLIYLILWINIHLCHACDITDCHSHDDDC